MIDNNSDEIFDGNGIKSGDFQSDNKNEIKVDDKNSEITELQNELSEDELEYKFKDSKVTEMPKKEYPRSLYTDARSCAVKIICRVERTDSYLDKLIDYEVRNNPFLNDYDKALLSELSYGVLRWMRRLDWFLNGFYRGQYEKCLPEVKNAMRVALYQILFLNKIPHSAAVNEAVNFVKRIRYEKHAAVVNGLLRTIIRTLDNLVWPTREIDEVNYLGIIQSHPNWIIKRWIKRFGFDNAEKLCESDNKRPILSIRVNKQKISTDDFLKYLNEKNIQYRTSNYIDYFFTIKIMARIYTDELFKEGYFTVQDISAGLISHLVNPQENEMILDICAAPGGKSSHLSELMLNKGKIFSVDKYKSKVDLMKTNFDRLGVKNTEIIYDDINEPQTEILKYELIGKMDKVLADVPCSGLGVLSKKPDIKWKRELTDIMKLQSLQLKILENAVKYIKPGGKIIYSTCTIEEEENIGVVKLFLERNPGFVVENAKKYVTEKVVNSEGCLEMFPHLHYTDGAFGAILKHNL
jgi:16S rRNA (cytosine967-C5)-methyltransferase